MSTTTQPRPTREEVHTDLINLIEMYDNKSVSSEVYSEAFDKLLDRLFAPDWVKIEDGCVLPEIGSLVEIHGKYGRDTFIFTEDGFNVQIDLGGLVETHWRYATPPPTEI
jgi:hypothetical protein